MKAKVLKGGWVWAEETREPGDEVEAPEEQVAAWEADGYVKRLPLGAQRAARVETAEAGVAPENAALPPWTMKVAPAEYLERFGEDAKNADLARAHLEAE